MPLDWIRQPAKPIDAAARDAAAARQARLTKPPGSLGRLEELAIALAGLQGRERPSAERVQISVYAADHGIAAEGVSAFPQAVTGEMVRNFAHGGAAISVLARALDAQLEVIHLGTVNDPGRFTNVTRDWIAPSTANFRHQLAMDATQLDQALRCGRHSARNAAQANAEIFVGGEMGIANTTSATALACALTGAAPLELAGAGTGLDAAGIRHKADVVAHALAFHRVALGDPVEALQRLGGFEIAALVGAFVACAQIGIAVLVDGFIASAAALAACTINPSVRERLLFAHRSAEAGHQRVLDALSAQPILDLRMRLGEGSGAAVAVPVLRLACTLHARMATFDEAGVSEKA